MFDFLPVLSQKVYCFSMTFQTHTSILGIPGLENEIIKFHDLAGFSFDLYEPCVIGTDSMNFFTKFVIKSEGRHCTCNHDWQAQQKPQSIVEVWNLEVAWFRKAWYISTMRFQMPSPQLYWRPKPIQWELNSFFTFNLLPLSSSLLKLINNSSS